MLLSEFMNRIARMSGHPRVGESNLRIGCQRCGGKFSALEVLHADQADKLEYRCPRDGAVLLQVGERSFELVDGALTVVVDDQEVDWIDFTERRDEEE